MSTFSQKQVPHSPAEGAIPEGVRRALLSWFNDNGVDHREVWKLLRQKIGYGEPQDVVDDVVERFGEPSRHPGGGGRS